MLELWKDPWPLDEAQCPCDVHFTRYLDERRLADQSIFHLGTGDHHHVGVHAAEGPLGNRVLGITATDHEYVSYMKLVVHRPQVGRRYKVLFGDIYQTVPSLLPNFDIVTLFHLCEFWYEPNAIHANLNDAGVLRALAEKVVPGGLMLFYTGSFAFDAAQKLIEPWAAGGGFVPAERYQSLLIYQKSH